MMNWGRVATIVAVLAGLYKTAESQEITFESLVAEMTDLRGLSAMPHPAYTCKQFSSYDRKSTTPADAESWFANADAGQFLRVEERDGRKEYVMMDADGPGAIVRIWSANPEGTLRIYLDGRSEPTLEAPMKSLLGGKLPGFPAPIACEVSRGWNSYLPIPYAKHCKVTSDAGKFYYHVNYRTYAAGTAVASFAKDLLEKNAALIQETARRLASPREATTMPADAAVSPFEVSVEPGQSAVLSESAGPGAISRIRVTLTAGKLVPALRQVILKAYFDGEQTVESPLGDFFGAAPGVNPYDSLPMGVTKDGEMWCHWHMPFAKTAKIELLNLGDERASAKGEIVRLMGASEWTPRSLLFHAKWRTERQVPTRPMQDWNYLTVKGRGVFAGVAFSIANPVKDWWGEGDEKIYVDGETFPSHFGTGTEDYFGYAWCCNEPFTHAYHNQPRCDGPGNYGHTSVNRWHILDRIPFERDFRFDMELWHWHATCKVDMAVTAYWYAAPGATDAFKPIRKSDVQLTLLPPYKAPRVKGAIEGETFEIRAKSGVVEPQEWAGLSGDKHLWWRDGRPGDKLVLIFPAKSTGEARVKARFLKAPDYGVIQIWINGKKAGEPIDLYEPGVKVSDDVTLGTFDLKEGDNELILEIVGRNPKSLERYMASLDYLLIEPVK